MKFKDIVDLGAVIVLFILREVAPIFLILGSSGLFFLSIWVVGSIPIFVILAGASFLMFLMGMLVIILSDISLDFLTVSMWIFSVSVTLFMLSFVVSEFIGG